MLYASIALSTLLGTMSQHVVPSVTPRGTVRHTTWHRPSHHMAPSVTPRGTVRHTTWVPRAISLQQFSVIHSILTSRGISTTPQLKWTEGDCLCVFVYHRILLGHAGCHATVQITSLVILLEAKDIT